MGKIFDQRQKRWLKRLESAINKGVEVRANHRFKYRNKCLGTFLVGAKRKNDPELLKKIEALGFDFDKHRYLTPLEYANSFLENIKNEKGTSQTKYINRFNNYLLPKKDLLPQEFIEEFNRVWKQKFNVERKWTKPETNDDRAIKWKAWRYDETNNPEQKWSGFYRKMGKLYAWVRLRKSNKKFMREILHHFNEAELKELKKEGFKW